MCILLTNLQRNNRHIGPMMKAMWFMAVLYSALLGLLIYYYCGRRQISMVHYGEKASALLFTAIQAVVQACTTSVWQQPSSVPTCRCAKAAA
jgi:hypothetical protein